MIRAALDSGLIPFGLGYYGRDRVLPGFRWCAVNGERSDYQRLAEGCRAQGQSVWLWSGPGKWSPTQWQRGLASLLERAEIVGAEGIIADPENGWPQLSRDARHAGFQALGSALGEASKRTRVGVTSFPYMPSISVLAAAAGPGVWGSPQMYEHSGVQTQAGIDRWWHMFADYFGPRCIPSVSGWVANTDQATPEGFARHLAKMPRAGGAIAFAGAGPMPAHIAEALAAYHPGGSGPGTVALWLGAWISRPAAAFALAALVIAMAIAIVVWRLYVH